MNNDANYIKNLSQNQNLLMIFNRIFTIKEISLKIIYIKSQLEKRDIYNYYNERYNTIAKEYYYLFKNHMGKFSFIIDSKDYIVKRDFKLDFYNYTGISYQVICLLHELIKLKNDKYITKECGNEGYDYWLNYDDKLYSLLSDKIMNKMKNYI